MDVTNGEVLAMASLPTYDANKARTITNEALFNRATLGVYEHGLDLQDVQHRDGARQRQDHDDRACSTRPRRSRSTASRSTTTIAQRRPLTVPEIFTYSSNIGSAKMAVDVIGPRGAEGLLRQARLAEAADHRAARARPRRCGRATGYDQHHDHRLRPRHLGDAAASRDRRRRPWSMAASSIRRPS